MLRVSSVQGEVADVEMLALVEALSLLQINLSATTSRKSYPGVQERPGLFSIDILCTIIFYLFVLS